MTPTKIRLKRLSPMAKLPVKGTEDAACFDFSVSKIEIVDDGKAILYLGWASEFSRDYVLTIQPRSSFAMKGWVQQNSPGQVDADYRGELQMRVEGIPNGFDLETGKMKYAPLPFEVGDRVCQGKLEKVIHVEFEEVSYLTDSNRGVAGFGSTGRK